MDDICIFPSMGYNPISRVGIIGIITITCVFAFVGCWRYKVIIDDKFVMFKFNVWAPPIPSKILIANIKNVTIEQVIRMFPGKIIFIEENIEKYYFDFVKKALSLQMKSGNNYKIAIKNAEKIKEEIEKRINK